MQFLRKKNPYNPCNFWRKKIRTIFEKESVKTEHLRKIKPFLKKHTPKFNFSCWNFYSLSFVFMFEGLNFFSITSPYIAFKLSLKNYLHTYIYRVSQKKVWFTAPGAKVNLFSCNSPVWRLYNIFWIFFKFFFGTSNCQKKSANSFFLSKSKV